MLTWFSMLGILGILQITSNFEVLKAINPYYAYQLLTSDASGHGFFVLGAVFLCTTGAESLYSDMGHCGRKNIRISWVFVKAMLLLNYFGQGAYLLQHDGQSLASLNDHNPNPFYLIMADWFQPIGIVVATLAAIIASQALISGSFTLINEAMRLNFWPKVKINYPTDVKGQLYIPSINWLLFVGCVGIILYFKESKYGACLWFVYHFGYDDDYNIIEFLFNNEKSKWYFIVPLIALYTTIEVSFLGQILLSLWMVVMLQL